VRSVTPGCSWSALRHARPPEAASPILSSLPDLPRIDEHAVEVSAAPHAVWSAVEQSLRRMTGGRRSTTLARLLGCRDLTTTADAPVKVGATIPGFHVSQVREPSLLALAGGHRFSNYRLTFHVDEVAPGRSLLRAETHAEFPGLHGAAYRALVIGTRGHVVAVRRMLRAIKRSAEGGTSA